MKLKLPKMKVPLFHCGTIYFCRNTTEFEYFFNVVDAEMPNTRTLNGLSSNYTNTKTGERIFLIALFNNSISTLAHEISHIAFNICDVVGVEVTEKKANETFCYLVGNIMDFALKHLEKPA